MEVDKLEKEKTQLQDTIDKQEISPADVERMNSELVGLQRGLESVRKKGEEVEKGLWEGEIRGQKGMDKVRCLLKVEAVWNTDRRLGSRSWTN